jgi:FkbM family methyltransferase
MHTKTTLRFAGDIAVVVPDDLNLITTYVIQEQGDWFEDEIKFVRRLLQAGQKAIDIGANYGLFTLTIAKAVGPEGRVWSFEPASSTAAFLAESIAANQWGHIRLDQRALSDHEGAARLSLNINAELNELIREDQTTGAFETVELTTLDAAMGEHGWSDVDFVKIDAEGEEEAIIRGGKNFFRSQSPLIQFEIKAKSSVNLQLVQAFQAIGYDAYRLVPGLDLLTPFDPHGLIDDYLLNLFCCKPDRARTLASSGKLVLPEHLQRSESASDLLTRLQAFPSHGWEQTLTRFPYGAQLQQHWQRATRTEQSQLVAVVLALHAVAVDDRYEAPDRFNALRLSTGLQVDLCREQPSPSRFMTLARVGRAFGARKIALQALDALMKDVQARRQVDLSEPFLAVSSYFETVDPKNSIADWFIGSALEELERNDAFSSFYRGTTSTKRLENIQRMGFGSPEMARRLELVKKKLAL